MRILVTEMAGRASVELKGRELGVDLDGQGDAIGRVVDQVKVLEADGWSFEAADASFELLLRSQLPGAPTPLFELESYRTSVEHWGNGVVVSEATVKVHVDGERMISTAEGNGPVNALDNALRQALVAPHPELAGVSLADYKVRILGWKGGTSATTRVLIDTTDGSAGVDHRRGARQHRRGVLARPRRRAQLRRPPPGRRSQLRAAAPCWRAGRTRCPPGRRARPSSPRRSGRRRRAGRRGRAAAQLLRPAAGRSR